MKNKELMATFKPATMEEILQKEYSAYCITGGEPLLDIKTINIASNLIVNIKTKAPKIAPIYLYTNGENLISRPALMLITCLDGINISPHRNKIPYKEILTVDVFTKVRVHRQDTKIDPKLIHFCADNKMALKIWHKDDCTTVLEDRFILTDTY
jgi:pyruvate formate-lyase activating enzyme-like uncharacterized protein